MHAELNVAIACANCGHRGVLHGPSLWRVFAIHRWDGDIARVSQHLRCSVCRRRPTTIEATTDAPTSNPFPKDETGWQRMVKRARD